MIVCAAAGDPDVVGAERQGHDRQRNVAAVAQHLVKDGKVVVDPADEITGAMLVTHQGAIR